MDVEGQSLPTAHDSVVGGATWKTGVSGLFCLFVCLL